MTWRMIVHHATPSAGRGPRHGRVRGADLLERPRPGPLGQPGARRDRLVLLGPRPPLAQRVRARPDPLDPAQHHRPPADRQVPHPRRAAGPSPARPPRRPGSPPGRRWSAPAAPARHRRPRPRGSRTRPARTGQRSPTSYRHPSRGLHARVRLAVITNREGPGAYLSSPAQRRRVGPGPRPRFNAKSPKTGFILFQPGTGGPSVSNGGVTATHPGQDCPAARLPGEVG